MQEITRWHSNSCSKGLFGQHVPQRREATCRDQQKDQQAGDCLLTQQAISTNATVRATLASYSDVAKLAYEQIGSRGIQEEQAECREQPRVRKVGLPEPSTRSDKKRWEEQCASEHGDE